MSSKERRGRQISAKRKAVLNMANELKNVSEACKRARISRTQFYEFRKRYNEHGEEGLQDLDFKRPTRVHPRATTLAVEQMLVDFSLKNPTYGCPRLCTGLAEQGIYLSASTIMKVLKLRKLATLKERWLALEERGFESLTPIQRAFVECYNPAYKEIQSQVVQPGTLLCQWTSSLGLYSKVGEVYANIVLDTATSMAFCKLHWGSNGSNPALFLCENVIPFYQRHGVKIETILTDRSSLFCNNGAYGKYLAAGLLSQDGQMSCVAAKKGPRSPDIPNRFIKQKGDEERAQVWLSIAHVTNARRGHRINGHAERFYALISKELFAPLCKLSVSRGSQTEYFYEQEKKLYHWVYYYNGKKRHPHYPNFGLPPFKKFVRLTQGE
jgi:hypothetical protein